MNVAIRKAAWSAAAPVDGWSDDLRWYAAAIHQMRLLTPGIDQYRPLAFDANRLLAIGPPRTPPRTPQQNQLLGQTLAALGGIITQWADPRSLGYQAQVHATYMFTPADWPAFGGREVLWHECAHGHWFFLPWHRAYLLEFERVCRGHIKTLGGPDKAWALPYWNSSDYLTIPDAALLPLALQAPTLPDALEIPGIPAGVDRPNPLHEPSRDGPVALVGPRTFEDWPDASEALLRAHYANAEDSNLISFAGGYLEDLTRFHNSGELGQIDLKPHGAGHVETGGFMSSFFTAGLDPVFWMHHANIDRLWETYAQDLDHGYPFPDGRPAPGLAREAHDSWAGRSFRFLRASGSIRSWTAPKVLDVEKLGYRYDTTAPPQFNAVPTPPPGADIEPFGLDTPDFSPLAAVSNVALAEATTLELSGGGGADGRGLVSPGQRWCVRLDGIRSAAPVTTTFTVALGSGGAGGGGADAALGTLTLFGVFESSLETVGGVGASRRFDASAAVADIPEFDPFAARLTLVPAHPDRDLDQMGITIDRISLEVA